MIRFKRTRFVKTSFGILSLIILSFAACKKDKNNNNGNKNPTGDKAAIELCDIIQEEGDVILESDPDRPVDYFVDCEISIYSRKLIIDAGTVIEFNEAGSLSIKRYFDDHSGAIIAKGNTENPIVFKGSRAEKGHWKGVLITSKNPLNELDYVIIRDAGRDSYTYGGQAGLLLGNGGYGFPFIKITNSQFLNNKEYGLETRNTDVDNNEHFVIKNNTFEDNDAPIYASIYTMQYLHSSNKINENSKNKIDVVGSANATHNLRVDGTWYNLGVPYVFDNDVYIDSKVIIEAGTVLKFAKNTGFNIGWLGGSQGTGGGLIAKGTPDNPIIFTSEEDIPKYWKGIYFASNYPGNEISNAIIENTGIISSDPSKVYNVRVGNFPSAYLKITDTEFRNSNLEECAIWSVYHPSPESFGVVDYENITVDEGQTVYCQHP